MKRPLEEASFNFNVHLQEIAAEYNLLLERCQILERSMKESVDGIPKANEGMHAPSSRSVPEVPAVLEASLLESVNAVSPGSCTRQISDRSAAAQVQLRRYWREKGETAEGLLTPAECSRTPSEPSFTNTNLQISMSAMDPNSDARLIFECITFFFCLYDTLTVPYELAWQPSKTVAFNVFASATVTFWWIEMGLNFLTGYVDHGMLVLDIKQTTLKYLSTWFILDFLINVVDLTILVVDLGLGEQHPTFFKYLRLGRLNRLARILVIFSHSRLQRLSRSLSIDSSSFTLLGLGMRLIAILVLLNHVICCVWYWIGSNSKVTWDTDKTWLDMNITSGGVQYRTAPVHFQYLTALHWAFTQMTPGSMSVVPQNSIERAWNVLCLILGLFVSALLISQLSAKMVRVQTVNSTQLEQMETLGRFISEHNVPNSLAQRIRRQVWKRVSQKKKLTMEDLPTLADLPTSLRQELHGAVFAPSLLSHSVLYSWCLMHNSICDEICFHVAEEEVYPKNEEMFVPREEAKKVYFLKRGSMTYRREVPLSASSMQLDSHSGSLFPVVFVAERDWISTAAMWCHCWKYMGRLSTSEHCDVVTFSTEKMINMLEGYPSISAISHSYASAYVQMVTSLEHATQVDLDILPSRVLMAMQLDERVSFSVPLLDSFHVKSGTLSMDKYYPTRRQHLGHQARNQLVKELETGKCVVTLGKDHQLLRTVGLCVLEIVESTGKVLVQIATKEQGKDAALDIDLPATKLRESETNRQAAIRLIQTELPEMKGTLHFGKVLNEEHETASKHLRVRTKYLKTTFSASLSPETFEDRHNSESVPNLRVNDLLVDWSRSLTSGQSNFRGLDIAMDAGRRPTQRPFKGERVSMACIANVTMLPVLRKDKTTHETQLYAWLQRHEFHQVKQLVPSNDHELMAIVLKAFETVVEKERMVSEGEGQLFEDDAAYL